MTARAHLDADMLSQYIDGRLAGAEVRTVEEHLVDCDLCRRELESLRRTVLLLRSLPPLPVPQSFVLSGTQRPRRPRLLPRLYPVFAGLSGLAAAMLAVLITLDLLAPMSGSPPGVAGGQAGLPAAAPAPAVSPGGREERLEPRVAAPKAQVREAAPEMTSTGENAVKDSSRQDAGPGAAPTASGSWQAQSVQPTDSPWGTRLRAALAVVAVLFALAALAARRAGLR